ncbi:uncharacterized protein LOC143284887 [Babylonia areolata]|uniref:uncharacterized protein LOC143284887 n=1 Tax=Babylonia areolata TaxID=304850 RepID=UPI003FD03D9E
MELFWKLSPVLIVLCLPTVSATYKDTATSRTPTKVPDDDDADNIQLVLSQDGSYNVTIRGISWLRSSPAFFNVDGQQYVQNRNLKLVSNVTSHGIDRIGRFVSHTYRFRAGQREVTATFKRYIGLPLVYFSQGYVGDTEGTKAQSADHTIAGFPAFNLSHTVTTPTGPLGYLAYGGIHCADTAKTFGIFGPGTKLKGGLEGGPLVLFDGGGDVVVVSSASHFMAASHWLQPRVKGHSAGQLVYGIMGGVDHVPAGTSVQFVLSYSSQGVNTAMEKWGSHLQYVYGRRDDYVRNDMTINYLGYYTDNGAYYYYETERHKNYQATILDVVSNANKLHVPYRYLEYDSWWYYKGVDNGVKTWEAMPDIFPKGMSYVYQQTGLRAVGHNRYWSNDTTYATQNGGRYNFILEHTGKAVPDDQKFWIDLLTNASHWGLYTYEQDWLDVEFEGVHALHSDLTLGAKWLRQMAQGAVVNNMTIQYCMSPARDILQTLENSVVTQARVSHDYQPGNVQWKIGVSSLLAHVLGLAPFKDNFWSSTHQPGNRYKGKEPNPELQLTAAVLSAGPVAPSDGIGFTNVTLLMRCCNAEGLILKPSKPATMIDDQIYKRALGTRGVGGPGSVGEVWATYSVISSHVFGIVLVADLQGPYTITPSMVGLGKEPSVLYVYESHEPDRLTVFSEQLPLVVSGCLAVRPCVYHTAPVLRQQPSVILLGELGKIVPISPQRITRIDVTDSNVIMHVQGASLEHVQLTFFVDSIYVTITCVIPRNRNATVDLNARSCT